MDERTRVLVRLSAALAASAHGGAELAGAALAGAMDAAAREADGVEVEEALLQSYLFLGYPAALNGIRVWRERTGRAPPPPAADAWEAWRRRGEAVCETVYGGQYARLRENVAALHPDLERWMLAEGYGKVLGRPGLPLWKRELCIVALLAPQDARPQLYAHLRGALHAGAEPDAIEDALDTIEPLLSAVRAAALRETWAAVRR